MGPASRRATYEDVLRAPPHKVAEILGGELHLNPRPGGPHAAAATALGEELGPPFKRGRGGPGGWIILDEPELHLGPDIVVPDLAGWRRTTLARVPNAQYIEVAPDWIAEVLSPRSERTDRAVNRRAIEPLGRSENVPVGTPPIGPLDEGLAAGSSASAQLRPPT